MNKFIDSIVLKWENVDISLNKWYSVRHWSFRNKEKEFWSNLFLKLLPKKAKRIDKYMIHLEYNSRLDPTNTITMIKMAEDTMKKNEYIIDDTKKYCKGITIEPNEMLGKKIYILTIQIISYASSKSSVSK